MHFLKPNIFLLFLNQISLIDSVYQILLWIVNCLLDAEDANQSFTTKEIKISPIDSEKEAN